MNLFTSTFSKIFKSSNQQELDKIKPLIIEINSMENSISSLKDVKYSFELVPALSIPRGKWIAPRLYVIRIPDILLTDAIPTDIPDSS